jgi:sugar phosphate isomerase/epimerase
MVPASAKRWPTRNLLFDVGSPGVSSLKAVYTVGVSTSSFFPLPLEDAFRLAKEAGAEGIEIMVTNARETQDPRVLDFLSRRFDLPIVSIHAPVLLLTHGVFGIDPGQKLERSAELAVMVGADTVVVHPPFRWQLLYATRFEEAVNSVAERYGVTVAVENMFGWCAGKFQMEAYAPSWDPGSLDVPSLTLDFSHAAMQDVSALRLARQWGERLAHIHLCDGTSPKDNFHLFDEHLLPGKGSQPVAETLEHVATTGFSGHVIAEVSTGKANTEAQRVQMVKASLDYARYYMAVGREQLAAGRSR